MSAGDSIHLFGHAHLDRKGMFDTAFSSILVHWRVESPAFAPRDGESRAISLCLPPWVVA